MNPTAYVVLNDTEKEVTSDITSAFENYGMKTVKWSQKEKALTQLED